MIASEAAPQAFMDETAPTLLLATTSRNALARLVHAAAVAVVVANFLGPPIAAGWFITVSAAGAWINAIGAWLSSHPATRAPRWCKYGLLAGHVVNSAMTSFVSLALWMEGGPAAHLCAVVILGISCCYSLLRFSGNVALLAMSFVFPTFALLAIAIRSVNLHANIPHAVVALVAGLVCIINFTAGSCRQIVEDRRSLMKARQQAADGEQAAEAANAAKSQFLAAMSHEIRTPLNGVLGMAEAMAADDLSETQLERLDTIRQSGEALLAILNDILDLSKVEAGKLELESADFSLVQMAKGAHSAFAGVASNKGLALSLNLQGAVGTFRGDTVRLRQILCNLISNALKFTKAGEVNVELSWREGVLSMIVSDTGIGIAPEAMERLFQSFSQADASILRRFGGTGLGLAICRHLAEAMNGSISVDSQVGLGTRFTVRVALERTDDQPAIEVRPNGADTPPTSLERSLRILGAEDNATNQLVLKTLLCQAGMDVCIVDNGIAAVEAWQREHWDVILMDIHMPEMDGPTATGRIRELERRRGGPRTPILALTADAMSDQVAYYLGVGMDGHIAKPIQVSHLFGALERVLGGDPETRPAAACS